MRKSSLIFGLMSILVVGSIGSLAYVSKGFKDFDYKTWFKSESDNILVDEVSENVFKVKYTNFDEDSAINYLGEKYDKYLSDGGCSAMAKQVANNDVIVGRNMDLYITNKPSYVIETEIPNRIKTIGLSYSSFTGEDSSIVKQNGISKSYYNVLPFLQTDVLNSNGLYIEINMRNATYQNNKSIFSCDGTNKGKKRVLASVLPYYLGSRCSSVDEAVNMAKTELDIFTPNPSNDNGLDWNFSFMLADSSGSYGVLEIARNKDGNQLVIYNEGKAKDETQTDESKLGSIQTNYYLSSEFSEIEKMGCGYGRVSYLSDLYPSITTESQMLEAIKEVSYFQSFDREKCKFDNKSEFVGYHLPDNYFSELEVWDIDFINNPQNEEKINSYIDWIKERISYYEESGSLKDVGLFWNSTFTLTANVTQKTMNIRFYEDESNILQLHF